MSLEEIETKYNVDFIHQYKNEYSEIIISLFNNDIIPETTNDNISDIANILGSYYCNKHKNHDFAKKYYLLAIENGNADAISSLGDYYKNNEKNYVEMKKYYLMAIEGGCTYSMYELACYYEDVEKNYTEMKKYYLMAIESGCSTSMNNLACYYCNIEKNNDLAKKYWLMAVENDSSYCMSELGYHYQYREVNYVEMKKYYLMAIEKNNLDSMNYLGIYYCNIEKDYNLAKKYWLMIIEKYDNLINKSDENIISLTARNLENRISLTAINLGNYYSDIEKNYDLMKKYYLIAVKINEKYFSKFNISNDFCRDLRIIEIYMLYFDTHRNDVLSFITNRCANLSGDQISKYSARLRIIYNESFVFLNRKLSVPQKMTYPADTTIN